MLKKLSISDFINKHSYAIELGFLITFITLYFVPIAFNEVSIRFTFTWITSKSIGYFISAFLYLMWIVLSIIFFIIKRKMSYFLLLYTMQNILENIILEVPIDLPWLNMYFSIVLTVLFSFYRWYQYYLFHNYWIAPTIKIKGNTKEHKVKTRSNRKRIEQLEREIEELKKDSSK